jgi:hypothetical protein
MINDAIAPDENIAYITGNDKKIPADDRGESNIGGVR